MIQALPLVGLVTATAIPNALRIIISVLTNYFLDGRLDDGRVLFPGLGLALCAIVCSTAAQASQRRTEEGASQAVSSLHGLCLAQISGFGGRSNTLAAAQ